MNWAERTLSSGKIPILAGFTAWAVSLWTAFSHPGSWEDDAYIFFRYAQNFAHGEGLAFNPGEASFGITSVLWTLLLGGFSWATRLEALPAAKILCVLLFTGSVWILTGLVQSRTQKPALALWVGMLLALCPPLVFSAVSGMEIALNLFLLSGLAASYFASGRKRFWLGGALIGLLFLTRPENVLLLAVWSFLAFTDSERRRQNSIDLFLGFTIAALPWQLYFYSKTGIFLPPTRTGKLLLFLPAQFGLTLEAFARSGIFERLAIAIRSTWVLIQVKNLLVFLPFLLLTGYYILRKRIALTRLWLAGGFYFIGLVVLFGFFFPLIKLRYFVHTYPFLILASALGCYHLWTDLRTRWAFFTRPIWTRAGILILFLSIPLSGFFTARKFAASSQQQDIRREIGFWLKENTPSEARVALEPIGAVGYHSGRYIVDLGGLVQPEVWPYMKEGRHSRTDSLLAFLERKGVDYLIDYSHHPWAGKVVDGFPEKFELVAKIQSPHPPAGADSYDIFKGDYRLDKATLSPYHRRQCERFKESVALLGKIRYMTLLGAYFDESYGMDDQNNPSDIVVVAGLISSVKHWNEFNYHWVKTLKAAGIEKEFHMSEYESGFGEFKSIEDLKRIPFLRQLIALLNRYGKICFGFAVKKSEMEIVKREFPSIGISEYEYLCLCCWIVLTKWQSQSRGRKEMDIMFDDGIDLGNEILRFFRDSGLISFGDGKKIIPLQGADFVAYEYRKHCLRQIGESCRKDRESFKQFIMETKLIVEFHNLESIRWHFKKILEVLTLFRSSFSKRNP